MKTGNFYFNLWKKKIDVWGINFSKLSKMSLDKLCYLAQLDWLMNTEREQIEMVLLEKADTDLIKDLLWKQYLYTSKARVKIIERGNTEEIKKMISCAYFAEKNRKLFDETVLDALFARGESCEILAWLSYTRFCCAVKDKYAIQILQRGCKEEISALADCQISDEIISKIIDRNNKEEIQKLCYRANKKTIECILNRNKPDEVLFLVEKNHSLHIVDGALELLFSKGGDDAIRHYIMSGGHLPPLYIQKAFMRFSAV